MNARSGREDGESGVAGVTVVIPTVGRASLEAAAQSALDQVGVAVHVIVVAARPLTIERIAALKLQGVHQVLVSQEILLGGAARNAGIAVAATDWIAFLDDDDLWDSLKLKIQLSGRSPSERVLLGCRLRPTKRAEVWPPTTLAASDDISEFMFVRRRLRGGEGMLQTSTLVCPTELARECRFSPDLAIHQDLDWTLRLVRHHGVRVEMLPDPLVTFSTGDPRSVSNMNKAAVSLAWATESRQLMTEKAFASFLLTNVCEAAARNHDYRTFIRAVKTAVSTGAAGARAIAISLSFLVTRGKVARRVIESARSRLHSGTAFWLRIRSLRGSGAWQEAFIERDSMTILMAPARSNRLQQPYNQLLTDGLENLGVAVTEFSWRWLLGIGRYDILHTHWPEYLFRGPLGPVRAGFFRLALKRHVNSGGLVVQTVHNTEPHGGYQSSWEKSALQMLDSATHGAASHVQSAPGEWHSRRAHLRPTEVCFFPLPAYPVEVADGVRGAERDRRGLPSDTTLVLHFGLLRAYKGTIELLQSWNDMTTPQIALIIAGEPDEEVRDFLSGAQVNSNVQIELGFRPEEELIRSLAACDVVLLPYRSVTTSGSLLLALSAGKPVAITKSPASDWALKTLGNEWVHVLSEELSPLALDQVVQFARQSRQPMPTLPTYDQLAVAIHGFYCSLLRSKGRSAS